LPIAEPLFAHLVPFVLVTARLSGVFLFSPLLNSASVPRIAKALLVVMLGLAVYPMVPVSTLSVPFTLLGLAPLLMTEILIGVCIGLIAAMPILALQIGGHVAGYQMGLAMASVYNPEFDTQSDVIGELLFYLGVAVFLAVGGLEAVWAALLNTYERVPLGAMAVSRVPLEDYVDLAATGFELALRISAPVMAMVFLVLVAMGFVMKTMPQINVMSIGFTVKILVGFLAMAMALQVIANVAADEAETVIDLMFEWSRGLAPR
jgi:flagellar biosynthetic protein FliR